MDATCQMPTRPTLSPSVDFFLKFNAICGTSISMKQSAPMNPQL